MAKSDSKTARPDDPEMMDTIRGFISLLIVIHLLGLWLMFWSNPLQPAQQATVVTRARRVFDNYMLPTMMDRGWGMRLTSNEEIDSDHFLQVIAKDKESNVIAIDPIRLPAESTKLPEERERWQRLASFVATHLDNEHVDGVVNEIGKQLLTRLQAENPAVAQLEIELRRRARVPYDLVESTDPLDPRWISQPIFVAFVSQDGFWRKSLDARDFAPVIRNAATPNATPAPPVKTELSPPVNSESKPQ
jgi:hypothetical protein